MKKIVVGIAASTVCAALLLSACGNSQNNAATGAAATEAAATEAQVTETAATEATTEAVTAEEASETVNEADGMPAVAGGWMINDKIETASITSEAQEAFDKALEGYVGMNLEPAALLATQIVAGTNYLYLCKGEPVIPDPEPGWYFVTVYNDLQGNSQITLVETIDIANIKTADSTVPADVVGGWTLEPPSNAATLPEDIRSAFSTAAEAYKDVTLSPLALLASQIVAGTNYKIFCHGTTTGDDPKDGLYVATMYVDLEDKAEFTDVEQVDLIAYLDASTDAAEAEVPAEYADYVGYQFSGEDPWGGEVSITIRSIDNGMLEATYTDVLGEDLALYAEMSGIPFENGSGPFSPAGEAIDDENIHFSYVGEIEFKDGNLVLTYETGSVDEDSAEGGSSAYNVEALDDTLKTVTLTKTVDPDEQG